MPDLAFAGRDLRDFDRRYAEQYFDATASALAEAAPAHLYLGARFTNGVRAPVAEASATRVDVLSINRYGSGVDTLPASLAADVPIIVSEFHFSANDTGLLSDGLRTVADQTARAEAYTRYLQTALNSDRVVGVHWLQYWDFPTSGRLNNSNDNSNLGFLTITDTPYAAMVEAARNIGAVIYESRAAGLQLPVIVVPPGQTLVDPTQWSGTTKLVKQGEGTLILEQPNSHSGGLVVEEGEVVIRSAAALNGGPLDIRAGARVTLDTGVSRVPVSAVMLDAAGRLDVARAGLVIAAGGFDAAAVRQAIVAGRSGGTWAGTSGITSAAAASTAGRAVGYAPGSNGSLVVAFAASGDTNLDGQVSVVDLVAIQSSGVYGTGAAAAWFQGDSNYDGVVSVVDMVAMQSSGVYGRGNYNPAPASQAAAPSSQATVSTATTSEAPSIFKLAFASLAEEQGPVSKATKKAFAAL